MYMTQIKDVDTSSYHRVKLKWFICLAIIYTFTGTINTKTDISLKDLPASTAFLLVSHISDCTKIKICPPVKEQDQILFIILRNNSFQGRQCCGLFSLNLWILIDMCLTNNTLVRHLILRTHLGWFTSVTSALENTVWNMSRYQNL